MTIVTLVTQVTSDPIAVITFVIMVILGTKITSVQADPMITCVTLFTLSAKITCFSMVSKLTFFTMVTLVTKVTSDAIFAMVTQTARCSELSGRLTSYNYV